MLWDLKNPSDPYTFRADSEELAFAVATLLGEGWYVATQVDGECQTPLAAFGNTIDLTDYYQRFGADSLQALIGRWLSDVDFRARLVGALETLLIGKPEERGFVEAAVAKMAPGDARALLARRHNEMRSSMNDIRRYADSWIARLGGQCVSN